MAGAAWIRRILNCLSLQFDIDTIGEMLEVDRRAVMLMALATLWLVYKFAICPRLKFLKQILS